MRVLACARTVRYLVAVLMTVFVVGCSDPPPQDLEVLNATARLKASLRDPESLKVEAAVQSDNHVICYVYRARNGFGGYTESAAIYRDGDITPWDEQRSAELFAAQCRGSNQRDVTAYAQHAAQ